MASSSESNNFRVVLEKIKQSPYYRNAAQGDEILMRKLAVVLSDKEQLKGFYLTTDWAQTVINAMTTLSDSNEGTSGGVFASKSGKKDGGMFKSVSEQSTTDSMHIPESVDMGEDDDSSDEELDLGEMRSHENTEMQKNLLKQDNLRVKIIVSEICESKGKKAFRQGKYFLRMVTFCKL